MELVIRSSRSHRYMVIGLVLLTSSVASSFFAVYRLEQAYTQRSSAVEAQDLYDDLAKKVKDWALVSHSAVIVGAEKDSEALTGMRSDLEVATLSLLKNVAASPKQLQLVPHLISNIAKLTNSKSVLNLSVLREIDSTLNELNRIENERKVLQESEVLVYIDRLTATSGVGLLISLILIFTSMRAKTRDDKSKAEIIRTLQSLKDEAESASLLKSKFLSTVSHEIRTPLNGIIGISDELMNTPQPGSDRSLAKTINQSGKTLLRIINDILDFSKIEAGKIELADSDFAIEDVLNQAVMTLSPIAAEKSVSLNYEIGVGVPKRLTADSDRLAQVLFNLIGNAIKFTESGFVVIRVRTARLTNDEAALEFSVVDTGIGIAEDDLKKLFTPFLQIRKTGTSGEAGTGLGLSISQSIVKAMKGEISVQSAVGRGSTFSFTIPFRACSREFFESQRSYSVSTFQTEANQLEPLSYSYKPRILVAEDNPTNQIVAQSMLSRLGVEVLLAGNGQEALNAIASSPIDLVLMDCQMPVFDGFEATQAVRNSGNSIPIIAMTANVFRSDEENCIAAGMNDFLSKPVDFFALKEKLIKHLPASRGFTQFPLVHLDSTVGVVSRKKVVRAFLSTAQIFKDSFAGAAANNNLEELNNLGHRFKSASQTVGGLEFSGFCRMLENADSVASAINVRSELMKSLDDLENRLGPYA